MGNNISLFISSLCGGGAERIITELYESLPKEINRKLIKIYKTDNRIERFIIADSESLVNYHDKLIIRLLTIPVIIKKYSKLLKNNDINLSLSFLPTDNVVNILACNLSNTMPIISFHLSPSYKFGNNGNIMVKFSILLSKHLKTRIISVSHNIRDELINKYHIPAEKIIVIYNPININKISFLIKEPIDLPQFNLNIPIILAVGRLENEKGHWHLIRVFSELRKKIPCKLVICGEGSLNEYLRQVACELNIIDDVIFQGWSENPYKYMAKATVFVQPSLSEALPNVIIEALYCGCPVIAADCGKGIKEIIDPLKYEGIISKKLSGIKHNADEPLDEGEQDLYFNLSRVIMDNYLRTHLSINGKERANFFSYEKSMTEYTNLIQNDSIKI